MKGHRSLHRALAMFAVMACPLLAGDSGYDFDLKVKAGFKTGTLQTDHADNKAFGFALGASRPFGKGRLTLEAGFDILPGQTRDSLPSGPIYAPAGAGLGTADPATGHPYFLRPNESLDLRKESSQGFSLKGGYAAPLTGVGGLSWQAGLSLDAYKTASEFTGTLRPMVASATGTVTQVSGSLGKYYEGFATAPTGIALSPGFYAGLKLQLSDDFALEFNLRNVGLKHFEYRPTTYTGRPASVDSSTIRGFVIDFALCMKL